MDNRSAFGHLAAILRKAQGRIDAETGKAIDVGYECAKLREQFDALWAEVERLREREAGLLEQHSRDSAELRRVCAERDEARADERTAMGYLAGVRQVVGGEDFPDMVRRVRDQWRGLAAPAKEQGNG